MSGAAAADQHTPPPRSRALIGCVNVRSPIRSLQQWVIGGGTWSTTQTLDLVGAAKTTVRHT